MWQWTGKTPIDLSRFDEAAATALIGRTVLIGKTYQKHNGAITKRTQQYGTIVQVHRTDGVAIQLKDSEEIVWLPPDMRAWHQARPGVYTLKSTGEKIENPDYVTTWIVDVG